MKGRLILILLLIIIIPTISAIRINEIELNPVGGSVGKEWIELYSEEEMDISGWKIYDGLSSPRQIYMMPENTKIEKGGYYIIELNSSKLNNDGDFVTLYNLINESIDKTPILKDSTNNNFTNQLCEIWVFKESTKEKENYCNKQKQTNYENNISNNEENVTEEEEEDNIETIIKIDNKNTTTQNLTTTSKTIENPVIDLSSKNINTEKDSSNQEKDKNFYVMYGVIAFCIFLAILFALKFFKENDKE